MADWGAQGLWDEHGRMYHVSRFPLPDELQQRILAWQEKFTEEAEPWLPDDTFDWDEHYEECIAIARAIKQELPDYEIVACGRRVNDDGSLGEEVPPPGQHLLED